MILEFFLVIGIIIGFLNARSINLADRTLGGNYQIYNGQSEAIYGIVAISQFIAMISTIAIFIWGFLYSEWYYSIIGLIISIILSQRSLIGNLMPFGNIVHILLIVLVIIINGVLWVLKLI